MRLKILHTFFCRLLFSSIAANVALTSTAPVADKSYRIVKIKLPKKHTHTHLTRVKREREKAQDKRKEDEEEFVRQQQQKTHVSRCT